MNVSIELQTSVDRYSHTRDKLRQQLALADSFMCSMLGHVNLSQTSTYLNATRIGLHDSMRRFEQVVADCSPVAISSQTDLPVRNDEYAAEPEVVVN